VKWEELYLDKCMENSDLKKEIRIVHCILRSILPIVEKNDKNRNSNK